MSITANRLQYLDAIGVQVWEERKSSIKVVTMEPDESQVIKTVTSTLEASSQPQADWFIVSESSSCLSDAEKVHVDHLLSNILFAGGVSRSMSHVVSTTVDSVMSEQQLLNDIQVVQPKVILLLGESETQNFLQLDGDVSELRGTVQKAEKTSVPIVVSHGIQKLMAEPLLKRETWHDVQLALQITVSEQGDNTGEVK